MDFSTDKTLGGDLSEKKIASAIDKSLVQVVEELDYDLDCRVQSSKINSKKPGATFPSINLSIGYAYKGSRKHEHLMGLKSPSRISIDYSLNEITPNIENIKVNPDEKIRAYSSIDIIAEKYRLLIQQENRNRYRRQDVYDINFLIENTEMNF